MGLARKDGAGALLAADEVVTGLMGSVAALLGVRSGYETAVASALGSARTPSRSPTPRRPSPRSRHLRDGDLGRAGLLLAAPATGGDARADWPALPDDATYAVDLIECPDKLRPALDAPARPGAPWSPTSTPPAGWSRRTPSSPPSPATATCSAHIAAGGVAHPAEPHRDPVRRRRGRRAAARGHRGGERLGFDLSRLEAERLEALKRVDVALAKLHESDATLAAVAEELGQYGSQARSAKGEAERLTQAIEKAEAARDDALAGLAELEQRLAAAESVSETDGAEPDTAERERLVEAARAARQGEMDARLALRTARGARPRPARPGRRRCSARPVPSARPGRARPSAASGCCARAPPPRPSASPSPTCSRGSRCRSTRPARPGSRSSRPAAAANAR